MKGVWGMLLVLCSICGAQTANGKQYAYSSNGRSYATVSYGTAGIYATGGNPYYSTTCSITAGIAYPACVLLNYSWDTGGATVQSVYGGGGTWQKFGSTETGNGNMRAECWASIPTQTGSQTVTVTMTGTTSNGVGSVTYTVYGANPNSIIRACYGATSGCTSGCTVSVSTSPGDLAASAEFDGNNNRTLNTGSCTTTLDETGFTTIGYSAAHCSNAATSAFTWSAINSSGGVAVGADVEHR